MKNFAFDFDGVIANTPKKITELVCEIFGEKLAEKGINHYCFMKSFDICEEEQDILLEELLSYKHTISLEPMPGAIEFLEKLPEIIVITTRSKLRGVHDFLEKYLPHFNIVHSTEKGKACRERGIDFFVDDHVENIIDIANEGIQPILFEWPYNCCISERSLLNKIVKKVKSWEDINKIFTSHLH